MDFQSKPFSKIGFPILEVLESRAVSNDVLRFFSNIECPKLAVLTFSSNSFREMVIQKSTQEAVACMMGLLKSCRLSLEVFETAFILKKENTLLTWKEELCFPKLGELILDRAGQIPENWFLHFDLPQLGSIDVSPESEELFYAKFTKTD